MLKEECIGEYDTSNQECKTCAVIHTCKRKQVKIIQACVEKWSDVQKLRYALKKLNKDMKQYEELKQKAADKKEEIEEALNEYNKFMVYTQIK